MVATGGAALNGDGGAEGARVAHSREVAATTPAPASGSRHPGPDVEGAARDSVVHLGGVGPYRAGCEGIAGQGYEGSAPTASAVTS